MAEIINISPQGIVERDVSLSAIPHHLLVWISSFPNSRWMTFSDAGKVVGVVRQDLLDAYVVKHGGVP